MGRLIPGTTTTADYFGHYVVAVYRSALAGTVASFRDRESTTADGSFVLELPRQLTDDLLRLDAYAPDGELLATITQTLPAFVGNDLDSPNTFSWNDVDPKDPTDIGGGSVVPSRVRLRGRVVHPVDGGHGVTVGLTLYATTNTALAATFDPATYRPVFVGRSDAAGHFFGVYPARDYAALYLVINGRDASARSLTLYDQDGYVTVDDPLLVTVNDDDLETSSGNADDDCGCGSRPPLLAGQDNIVGSPGTFGEDLGGGGCVDFTTPNRTLEEFIFCHVVRTTEPEIKGLTLNAARARRTRRLLRDVVTEFNQEVETFDRAARALTPATDEEIEIVRELAPGQVAASAAGAVLIGGVSNLEVLNRSLATDRSGTVATPATFGSDDPPPPPTSVAFRDFPMQVSARPQMIRDRSGELQDRLTAAVQNREMIQESVDAFTASPPEDALGLLRESQRLLTELIQNIGDYATLVDDYASFQGNFAAVLLSGVPLRTSDYARLTTRLGELRSQLEGEADELERAYALNHPGRREVDVYNNIDWDETPTVYQNTTIAHGHILCFKQTYKAAGYSMGDLIYSLPLAPCQKKQIAVLEWQRGETAGRTEEQVNEERLTSELTRDRDVTDLVSSALRESSRGSSRSSSRSRSARAGISGSFPALGGIIGVSGGFSSSRGSSGASSRQNSSRNVSASAMNKLRDSVQQSAASMRSQRSTVIQTVQQGESVRATTEVIRNHNHCKMMTVEYFQVLRHLVIEQELIEVAECLFVPLRIEPFDFAKVLRWRNRLAAILLDDRLAGGFAAIDRINNNYRDSPYAQTTGMLAGESIQDFSGNLRISFEIVRPQDEVDAEGALREEAYRTRLEVGLPFLSPTSIERILARMLATTAARREAVFQQEEVPRIVREFIDQLQFTVYDSAVTPIPLNLDATLVSRYARGVPLYVTLYASPNTPLGLVRRDQILRVKVSGNKEVGPNSRIILHDCRLDYRTANLQGSLFRRRGLNNDVINEDAALIYTPLNDDERRNPRREDQRMARRLVDHLNEYLEAYHRSLWMEMDPGRLFGLLDGFIAPNSGGRSVASVVENRVLGVVGNNLVLKVAPGFNLDPLYRLRPGVDLLEFYRPLTPPEPFRVSLPTPGVYAEAVLGQCNSCEEIDESRHWRFTEVPCGDEPTAIDSVSTASRRSDPGSLQPKAMESPVVNIQNAPTAPSPAGLGDVLELMGKNNLFRDMTGLSTTQANALAALTKASTDAGAAAQISADIVKAAAIDDTNRNLRKELKLIDELEREKKITPEDARKERLRRLGRKDEILKPKGKDEAKPEEPEEEDTEDEEEEGEGVTLAFGDDPLTFDDDPFLGPTA